jgi:hypothetical protein
VEPENNDFNPVLQALFELFQLLIWSTIIKPTFQIKDPVRSTDFDTARLP